MSLLNFPTNPNVNDTWVVGSKTYKWTGSAWVVISSSLLASTVQAGSINVSTSTNSTSSTTGAIIVTGGVGVGQDVFINGNITVLGTINGAANLGGVTVQTTTTNISLYVPFISTSTGTLSSMNVDPTGLTYNPATQILTASGQLVAGSIQNTPIGTITPSIGSFTNLIATAATITGVTQSFSTDTGALVVAGGVGIGGDLHVGGTFYSGGIPVLTTASFNNSPADGQDIDIVDLGGGILQINAISTLQSVTNRGKTSTNIISLTNQTESVSTTTGALVIKGGLGVGKRINCESIKIADTVFDSTEVLVNSLVTVTVDSYSVTEFRSAKYLVQIDSGVGIGAQFQVVEILLLADNAGTVYATEYGLVTSHGELGTFSADLQMDNIVRLYFTPFLATDKTIYVLRTGMAA